MFTIKLIRNHRTTEAEECASSTVVACNHYDVHEKQNHALIIANGIEYRVHGEPVIRYPAIGSPPRHFNVAFIENQSGKTIDRIGPFEQVDEIKDAA
jgi:hypothetical protein